MTRELKIFSTIAVQSALEALVPQFEVESGFRLGITWNNRTCAGEALAGWRDGGCAQAT